MKKLCFDCAMRKIENLPLYDTKDEVMKPYFQTLGKYDLKNKCGHWNPEYWEKEKGFERNWGDASVGYRSSFQFEVLKKLETEKNTVEFVILCPKLLRRPLILNASYDNKWGFSAHGSY